MFKILLIYLIIRIFYMLGAEKKKKKLYNIEESMRKSRKTRL